MAPTAPSNSLLSFPFLALLLLLLLPAPAAPHVCVHDEYTRNITKVRAPSSGVTFRRDAVTNAAPIRIVPLYRASNGGTDISTETGMSASLKAVVVAAMDASLARFSALLRVTPVSGNLFAYRPCTSIYSNGRCKAVNTAPKCGTAISLSSMLGTQTYYPVSSSTSATLPATGAGVPNADTAIFVTAQQTTTCSGGTLAYASACQQASDDRPTFGLINFCPDMLPASTTAPGFADLVSTALHELTHVLVFSSSLFPYFRDEQGGVRTPRDLFGYPSSAYTTTYSCSGGSTWDYVAAPSTISYANERGMSCSWGSATSSATANIPYGSGGKTPNDCVARISTPRVAAAARVFFNCSTLAGADLENQDTSTCFLQGSHWDARTLASEYMAAYSSTGDKISPMTLAVFEDSGWYSVDYSSGDAWVAGKDWGYKQGCAFAAQKCASSNAGSPPHFFFSSALGDVRRCTLNRRAKGVVSTVSYTSALPAQYRYFSSSTWGGDSDYYDYCPVVTPYSNGDCTSTGTSASTTYGEVVGAGSLCHMSTLNSLSTASSSTLTTGCYAVSCGSNGASYTLTAKTGAKATCTREGATVTFSGYGGSVECGSPASVCGAGELWDGLVTPSITPSKTPSSSNTPSISSSATTTPIGSPSPGSPILRLSFIFSGATSGTFSTSSQTTIFAAVASTLGVPTASLSWLGVTSASAAGLSRELQGGSRVQLGLNPIVASTSSLIQGSMASSGGGTLSSAVSSLLSAGLSSALAAQPGALNLAIALGYTSVSAMQIALSLDSNYPVVAVVVSLTPSPLPGAMLSPIPSRSVSYSTLSPGETGALVSGILLGCGLALYFITICIVACCVKYTWCCNHVQCREDYSNKSVWCRCLRLKPSMVVQAPSASAPPPGDFYPNPQGGGQAPYPYPQPYGAQQQGYPMPPPYPQHMAMPYAHYPTYSTPAVYPPVLQAKQG